MAREVVWHRLFCRGSGCGVMFYICGSCYRGQVYCGDGCRGRMRREQKRRAKRRHQQSREGRLDHRDRQRAYRERCRLRRVTDHTSVGSGRSGNIGATWTETGMSTPLAEGIPGSAPISTVPDRHPARLHRVWACGSEEDRPGEGENDDARKRRPRREVPVGRNRG